jgi:hypothetical protein
MSRVTDSRHGVAEHRPTVDNLIYFVTTNNWSEADIGRHYPHVHRAMFPDAYRKAA